MGKTFKDMKQDGKVTLDGPKVKDRKPFAPGTQKHKAKKGKGSYDRKPPEEIVGESASIVKFIEAIMTEDHAKAHKYLKDTINKKIQEKISQEIEKPLF